MKPKGLGELRAATSDLANQTGTGKKKQKKKKNRSLDHPQAELDILSFQKTYKYAMETRGPKSNSSELLYLSCLVTSNFDDDSIKNEWVSIFPL